MTLAVPLPWVYVDKSLLHNPHIEALRDCRHCGPHQCRTALATSSHSKLTVLPLLQAIGGTIWHGIKGFRNSPYGERRIGAITAIKMRAPVLGGNFGVWGGLFSTFDCTVKGIRKKEDPYNAIMYALNQF